MTRRAAFGIIGSLVAAALAGGCDAGPSQAIGRSPTTTRPPTTRTTAVEPTTLPVVTTSLSVVSCPTTWGISTPVTMPLPVSVTVSVPEAQAATLAVYSDTDEIMMLIAPKGWTCSASYGADGSGGVDLVPPGARVPTGKVGPGSSVQAIAGFETGGSPVQAAAQACSLFPAAATALESDLEKGCPPPPTAEKDDPISASAVGFEDPPGVEGAGTFSGGENPANGVATYSPDKGPGYFSDTCTMPQSEHDLCTAALNYFITRYGQG